jgi:hypothetical protein
MIENSLVRELFQLSQELHKGIMISRRSVDLVGNNFRQTACCRCRWASVGEQKRDQEIGELDSASSRAYQGVLSWWT